MKSGDLQQRIVNRKSKTYGTSELSQMHSATCSATSSLTSWKVTQEVTAEAAKGVVISQSGEEATKEIHFDGHSGP